MDPHANLTEQREIAEAIIGTRDDYDRRDELTLSDEDLREQADRAERLAELVQALDEWRSKGGFDPDASDAISRESIIEALRDAERHDSAADAVEYVSDLVGWEASSDPVLQREAVERLVELLNEGVTPVDAIGSCGFDPEEISTEHEGLGVEDPDNDVIDPLIGFFAKREDGQWRVVSYDEHRRGTDGA